MTDLVENQDETRQQSFFKPRNSSTLNQVALVNPTPSHEFSPAYTSRAATFDCPAFDKQDDAQQVPQDKRSARASQALKGTPISTSETHPQGTEFVARSLNSSSNAPWKTTSRDTLTLKAVLRRTSNTHQAPAKNPFTLPSGKERRVSFSRMPAPSSSSSPDGRSNFDRHHDDRSIQKKASVTSGKSRTSSENDISRANIDVSSLPNPGMANPASRQSQNALPNPSMSILPAEKVFPIQIGSELFRLSGASIASDAPSYFSQFFEEQIRQNEENGGIRTLYIDRDPVTFRDISRHLQGYHVKPLDGSHFVKLFADAQFYSLPRLISQLFESEIFIQIGDRHFQIPRDIFSGPGDSPNFFSLGFAVFFSTPQEVFPGLDRKGLLRPPSILPPSVPHRSAEVFAQLLHLLRGYPLHIKNEDHRSELLRDCRYFHLRGLEQKIIAHQISFNLERQKTEICIRLEDLRRSGISLHNEPNSNSQLPGWVYYARPFVEDTAYELVLEIGNESTLLDLSTMRADFHSTTKDRVSKLLQVIATKMNLPNNAPLGLMMITGGPSAHAASPSHTPLSAGEDRVKVALDYSTDILLDGEPKVIEWPLPPDVSASDVAPPSLQSTLSSPSAQGIGSSTRKRKRGSAPNEPSNEWIIQRGQWRLRVDHNSQGGLEITFVAVKLNAFSGERARNATREWLG